MGSTNLTKVCIEKNLAPPSFTDCDDLTPYREGELCWDSTSGRLERYDGLGWVGTTSSGATDVDYIVFGAGSSFYVVNKATDTLTEYAAPEDALTYIASQTQTSDEDVVIRPGPYALDDSPAQLSPNTHGFWRTWSAYGAVFTINDSATALWIFNKSADYDDFGLQRFMGFTIDGNNVDAGDTARAAFFGNRNGNYANGDDDTKLIEFLHFEVIDTNIYNLHTPSDLETNGYRGISLRLHPGVSGDSAPSEIINGGNLLISRYRQEGGVSGVSYYSGALYSNYVEKGDLRMDDWYIFAEAGENLLGCLQHGSYAPGGRSWITRGYCANTLDIGVELNSSLATFTDKLFCHDVQNVCLLFINGTAFTDQIRQMHSVGSVVADFDSNPERSAKGISVATWPDNVNYDDSPVGTADDTAWSPVGRVKVDSLSVLAKGSLTFDDDAYPPSLWRIRSPVISFSIDKETLHLDSYTRSEDTDDRTVILRHIDTTATAYDFDGDGTTEYPQVHIGESDIRAHIDEADADTYDTDIYVTRVQSGARFTQGRSNVYLESNTNETIWNFLFGTTAGAPTETFSGEIGPVYSSFNASGAANIYDGFTSNSNGSISPRLLLPHWDLNENGHNIDGSHDDNVTCIAYDDSSGVGLEFVDRGCDGSVNNIDSYIGSPRHLNLDGDATRELYRNGSLYYWDVDDDGDVDFTFGANWFKQSLETNIAATDCDAADEVGRVGFYNDGSGQITRCVCVQPSTGVYDWLESPDADADGVNDCP